MFLIGEWRSDQNVTYHLYRDGTFWWHIADEGDMGRWKLRTQHQLELVSYNDSSKKTFGRSPHRELVLVDRVEKDIMYVRRAGHREKWVKLEET